MALLDKRVYEGPEGSDRERLLVDRLWPRALSKEEDRIDPRRKDLAPSDELRRWFSHEANRWESFKRR